MDGNSVNVVSDDLYRRSWNYVIGNARQPCQYVLPSLKLQVRRQPNAASSIEQIIPAVLDSEMWLLWHETSCLLHFNLL